MEKHRVGIMGGTFNPPHIGHLLLAEWARQAASLEKVIFLPTGNPYMKDPAGVLEGRRRLEMVKLAIADQDGDSFAASDMELRREGATYTYITLEELGRAHPDCRFYFIMGADCLFSIERWKEPQRIFRACTVIAAGRGTSSQDAMEDKQRELTERFGADILLLDFPAVEISSTDIRERVSKGLGIRYMVPDRVLEYIVENGLYREQGSRHSGGFDENC